jgi:simple sugar transport system permease protein
VVGLAGVLVAVLVSQLGVHPVAAFVIVLAISAAFGACMGAAIHFLRVPPFIVTLAGMFMARGLASILTQDSIPIDHDVYRAISGLYYRLPGGGRLSAIGLLMLFVFLVGGIIAHKTRFGSYVYALGGNPTSAALMGVPVARTTIGIYALASFLGGLAGIVYSLYTSSGYPLAAVGMELDAIAAVVIGGTLLTGGYGFIFGTLIGVMLQGLVQTYIVFDGTLSSWWTKIAIGLLLFMFILLQKLVFSAQGRGPRLKRAPA